MIAPRAAAAALLGLAAASLLHAQPAPGPVISATQDDGVTSTTRVSQGSNITYTVNIRNTGTSDATNVTLTDPAAAHTSDVANTLTATPVAVDDTYPQTIIANMSVNTATSGFSVVSNDFKGFSAGTAVPVSSLTVAVATGPSHGTVSLVTSGANVGQFTYTPAAGYTGADSFTYTISNGVSGGNTASITGTCNLTVSGPVIWFVDTTLGDDTTGDGTLAKPFKSLTKVALGDAANQEIFVYSGNYSAGLTLESGESLIGQGAPGSFDTVLGIAPGSDSPARPALGGANPIIAGSITLGSNNTLNGFTCGNSVFPSIGGTTIGTLTVANVLINNLFGQALNLISGTVAGTGFTSVTSGGGTNNISLASIAGTLNLGGGALSGSSTDAFTVNSGTGTINYSGTITNTTGKAVQITSKTGGTVTLSGDISNTSGGTGINLGSNTGATIAFTGAITASTGANTAFNATGGGTVSANNSNNTLSTTSGTALNVANTTIAAAGLTFKSINSGAGSNNGIVLDTTGSSGGLTVTGVSGSAGSGGTIANKSGSDSSSTAGIGIYLNNTTHVSLAYMSLQGNNNFGIRGNNVTGFTLDHSVVGTTATNGSSNTADVDATSFQGEGGVRFYNLLGTATISNCTLDNGFSRTVAVSNDTGTLTNLTFTNSSVANSLGASTASDALFLQAQGSSTVANLTVTGSCQFTAARQFEIQTNAKTGATLNVSIGSCSFKNTNTSIVGASNLLVFNGSGTNTWVTFNLNNNTFTQGNGLTAAPANAGRILTAGMVSGTGNAGTFFGKIINNTFGVSGLAHTAGGDGADAIGLFAGGNNGSHGGSRFLVQNNTIQNYGQTGIQIGAVDGNSTIDATVLGNTIRQPGSATKGAFAGIWAYAGNGSFDTNTVNIAIGGSIVADKNALADTDPANLTDVFLGNVGVPSAVVNLYKNGSAAATVNGVLTDDNIGTLDLVSNTVDPVVLQAGLPAAPPLLAAPGGIQPATSSAKLADPASPPASPPATATTATPATQPHTQPATTGTALKVLEQADLDRLVADAIARWRATGLSAQQLALLEQLRFETADLAGMRLGEADGKRIRISRDAGGNGWFIDSTSASDGLFGKIAAPTRRHTDATGVPAGRMDLLTAVLHEMGHALGLDDSYAMPDRDNLMYGQLTVGERRLPATDQAAGVKASGHEQSHFLSAAVTIGTLPAGKSVVLTYQVKIDKPANTTSISSQGTVGGSNFTSVSTDDPETGTANDATVTLLGIPPAVSTQPSDTSVIAGQQASFTAAASGAPTPTVQWQESSDGGANFTDIGGATSATYTFTPVVGQNGHKFRAVFTNDFGSDTSTAATLTVVSPPAITAAFGVSSVVLNNNTTLTFTVTNPNTIPLTGVAFTDTLPSGLVVATPNGQSGTTGGGTVTATAGSGSISLTGATVPASGNISFVVNVTGTTAGVKNNSVQVTSTEGGNGNTSNGTLTVVAPPVITQAFGVPSIALNGSTTLTFTVQNNNTTTTLTGIGFSETLPAGLVVTTPNGLTGAAGGGTITATAGSGTISVTGATLAPTSSFTFAINVTGTAAGTQNATTGNVTSTEAGAGGTALASLQVIAPPAIAMTFGASNIALNATTTLTITLTNPAANTAALTGVAFSNTLPAGLIVATPNGLVNTAGGTVTAVAGSGSITLSGGTLATNASATVTVNVTGTSAGVKINSTGNVASTNGGTGGTANASLTVASAPAIAAAFGVSSVALNGNTSLTFTVTNPNTIPLTGVAFTDTLPSGLVVATPNGQSGTTGGGTVTATAGSGSISLTGATVPASGNISFVVNVTGTSAGVKNNSVQVTSTEGGNGNTSNGTLTVVAPPVITQVFGASSIPLNGSTTLTFTVQNNNTTTALTGIAFSETLPAGLVVATPNGLTGAAGGGTITATAGSGIVSVSGAGLSASGSFTFAINVTGTAAGTQNATTGNITSTEGGTGGTASANLQVIAPPNITMAFGASTVNFGGTTTLTITLANPAANPAALTGVAFTNTLPAGLVVATPNGLVNTAGGTVTAVAGSGSITLSGGTLATNASATITVNVTGTTAGVKNNTTGNVASTNGGTGGTANASLTVLPPVDHFAVSAPSSSTAGTSFNVTVTAQDINNTTVPGYTGTLHFTSSDGLAVLPSNSTLTNGTGTFAVTLKTSGNQTVSVADTVTPTVTGTSGQIAVSAAAADHLAYAQAPSNTTAGVAISPAVTVRILDAFNNIATTNTSNVTLAIGTNPAGGTLSGTTTVAAVAGVATFSTPSINKTGTGYTLTATDGVLTGATSNTFNITPAAASLLVFTGVPATATAGNAFNFTVTARDAFGNVATGYLGTVHFTSTDAAALLAGNYTFLVADAGTHTFSATLESTGAKTLTATDTVTSTITGTSSSITVTDVVSLTATDASAAVSGGDTGTYRFTRNGNGGTLTANFVLNAGSTATAADFSLSGGSVTFSAGTGTVTFPNNSTTVDVTLTAAANPTGIAKPALTAQLDLTAGTGYTAGAPNSASVVIAQNGFTVYNTSDSGAGSLRQAVLNANALPGADTITFAGSTFTDATIPDVITLTSGEIVITGPLTISGPGANALHISGNHTSRVFNLASGNYAVRLDGLTVRDGAVTDDYGAGIFANQSGSLTLTRCVVANNQLTNLGGSVEEGAGICQRGGQLVVRDSTVSGNSAVSCAGGGISLFGSATLQLVNSTVSGNLANQGGAISLRIGTAATLVQSTVTANTANTNAGGVFNSGGMLTLANSIVAGNTSASAPDIQFYPLDPSSAVNSLGGNLICDNSSVSAAFPAGTPNGNGDAVGTSASPVNPLLGPLANNGGPFQTHALLNGSLAINLGKNANIPADTYDQNNNSNTTEPIPFDQRGTGFARLIGTAVDSGAIEALAYEPTVTGTTTDEDVMSTSGLVITANPADGGQTSYYRITGISNGTLYQHDGTTAISAGDFITKAQGSAGLRFLANANLNDTTNPGGCAFSTQAAVGTTVGDLRGNPVTTGISVIPVNDPPTVIPPGIPDQTLLVGHNLSLPLSPYFTDIENDTLTFTVTNNSNSSKASATINGTQVALSGLANGVTDITVQANDGNGGTVNATFHVAVGTVNPSPLQIGTSGTLNRQNGLFELTVNVTNTTPYPINGFRLHVDFSAYLAAYPSLRLYNATSPAGSSDVYADYPYPVAVDTMVPMKLTFYTSTRTFPSPFAPVLTVEKLSTSQVPDTNGHGVQPRIVVLPDHTVLLEFSSVIGHWYRVRYSSDMTHWSDSPVPLQASTTRMQWIDNGPPFTNVSPASVPSRFYIVNDISAP